ncbi:uncharacterized protein LOC144007038 isoform X1 [Festucalex cinctus]
MLVFQRAEVTSMEPDVQAVDWREWSGMAQEEQRPPVLCFCRVVVEEETFVCLFGTGGTLQNQNSLDERSRIKGKTGQRTPRLLRGGRGTSPPVK